MKVFSDYHHSGLYFSFHLLFEERLGWELYRPIGMEWFPQWWDIAKPYGQNESTAKQYLEIRDSEPFYAPTDGSPVLNSIVDRKPEHYVIEEIAHGYRQKAMTFQQFLDTDIDIIVASLPDHWVTYTKLRDMYKPKAKVICQSGNIFWENEELIRSGTVKNLMASTKAFPVPEGVNAVSYHQEQPVIPYKTIKKTMNISSYVHLLPLPGLYEEYSKALPQYNWRAYGAGCPNGLIHKLSDLYQNIQDSDWVYNVKPRGDGYGWVWHSAFMLGRPVITNASDYRDKLGGELFEDGITGIDLEKGTVQENALLIKNLCDNDWIQKMGDKARERWEQVVNYDAEFWVLQKFLERLI